MDGVFDPQATAGVNLAGLIRATNDGLCSGEPRGIRYPNVPSVADMLEAIGIDHEGEAMDQDDWDRACCVIVIPDGLDP
jgi:hypothetical protein